MPPRHALQSVRLAPPRVRGALWRYGNGMFYDILCTCERREYSFSGAWKTLRIFYTFLCLCRGVCKRVGRSKEKTGLRKFKKGPRNFKICPTFFCPFQTRMDKAFPKTRSVQQKSPLSLSVFSRPVSPPKNSAAVYLFIVTMLLCFVEGWQLVGVENWDHANGWQFQAMTVCDNYKERNSLVDVACYSL